MSESGVKSSPIRHIASRIVASLHSRPVSAASAIAARFGTPAMPPNAIRASVTLPSSTVTWNAPQTAEMS